MTKKQQYRLIVKKGPNPGHFYPIFAERITIGRDPMSDIIFKDPEVSRRHVQFVRVNDSYQVEDLGSTNGTFVNGERLSGEPAVLAVGQEIALGGAVTLIFEEEDSDTDLEAIRTINANLPDDGFVPPPESADYDDDLADFVLDDALGTSELDGDAADDEAPHIDQLQSLSPITGPAASPHAPSSQPTDNAPLLGPLKDVRTVTNQQIVYIVIGTALSTMVCCGSVLLFMYFIGGDWLLNRF